MSDKTENTEKNAVCHIIGAVHLEKTDSLMIDCVNKDSVAVLPTRNLVLFPGVTVPLTLVRDQAKDVAAYAHSNNCLVALACQLDSDDKEITSAYSLHQYGMLVQVMDIISLPDNSSAAVVRGVCKYRMNGPSLEPCYGCKSALSISITPIKQPNHRPTTEYDSLVAEIIRMVRRYDSEGGETELALKMNLDNLPEDDVINFVCTAFPFTPEQKIKLLTIYRLPDRGKKLMAMLQQKLDELEMVNGFRKQAREGLDRNHREAFMREEMEAIRRELYGDEDPAEALRAKAAQLPLPEDVAKSVQRDLAQLSRTSPSMPDFSVLMNYLETLLGMPWGVKDEGKVSVPAAEKVLDEDHYGLTKVKDRILEQIAVAAHNPEGHSPILCLVGPPGVGKTSLGQSVARAMGRKFQRVSLGGLHDEAEIRGHRRTYIGALPGRVITAVRRAGTMNPVLLLDEVDKIGKEFQGDPSAALLEVLDPEQNCHFHDNYLDVDFDLSNVLFIATANTLQTLSQPLLDRMEVIELSGYAAEEKVEIARRHLIPRVLKANALTTDELRFADGTIRAIIDSYTAESGVRQLEKMISKIARRVILERMKGDSKGAVEVAPSDLEHYLGKPTRHSELYEGNDIPGVVTGLAWTAVGGEILFIEAAAIPDKEGHLSLTGNLGDVMKESAQLALQYVRSHAAELGIDAEKLHNTTVHIHVPAGAIPKDGPSAGVTMVTAIVSALTGRRVRPQLAMTGEETLRGRVTPIGGVKEKILAAKRAGITVIALPEENRRDVEEIEPDFLTGLEFHYFDTIGPLLKFALPE